jgi:hypothetical protein
MLMKKNIFLILLLYIVVCQNFDEYVKKFEKVYVTSS